MGTSVEKIAWYSVFKPSWYVEQMKGWTTRSYCLLLIGIGLIVGMTVGGGTSVEKIAWYSVFKPSWYVEQMKGWTTRSYCLLLIGIGLIVGMTVGGGIFNPVTMTTMLAGVLGFTCTLSISNSKPLNGILGLISALIYIFVAINAKNYNDVLLQTIYILALDLPVLLSPSWAKDVDKKVRFLGEQGHGLRNWTLTVLLFVVLTLVLYYSDTHWFISPRPWVDSIAASVGITGAVLTTFRFSESYFCWLAQGLLSVTLWGITAGPRPWVDSIAASVGITGAVLTTFRFSESYFCWLAQGLLSVTLWGITAVQGDANFVLFVTYLLYLSNDFLAFFDKDIAWFHHEKHQLTTKQTEKTPSPEKLDGR